MALTFDGEVAFAGEDRDGFGYIARRMRAEYTGRVQRRFLERPVRLFRGDVTIGAREGNSASELLRKKCALEFS